jgi:hypothetical protein
MPKTKKRTKAATKTKVKKAAPKKCPSGEIKRKGYARTTKYGKKVKVPAACIKDQGFPGKTKPTYRKLKPTTLECPRGQIARASYTRKAYTKRDGTRVAASRVPESCVRDVGAPGKGLPVLPTIPPIQREMLRELGYSLADPAEKRREVLKKAVAKHGINTLIWHLNYLRNISAYAENKAKYAEDMEFVRTLRNHYK